MTYDEIVKAIDSGKKVCWGHIGYNVIKDSIGQYLIHCTMNDTYVGLRSCFFKKLQFTPTMNESEFFVVEE